MRIGTNLLCLLLALCFLLAPVWGPALTASAQDEPADAIEVLEQKAAKKGMALGEYLWDKLHGAYPSLGDLAAGSLEAFLEDGGTWPVEINGKSMTITLESSSADNSETGHEASYGVELEKQSDSESGTLYLYMDAVRAHVNDTLYPMMIEASEDPEVPAEIREDLKQDLAKLLDLLDLLPKAPAAAWDRVWSELAEKIDNYPAIAELMDTQSEEPLIEFVPDGDPEDSPVLTELFDDGSGSGTGTSGISSGAALVRAFNTIDLNPVPDAMEETVEDLIQGDDSGDDDPGHDDPGHHVPGGLGRLGFLLDTVLPATGFSTLSVTERAERPMSLSYGETGMFLQIPELDVSETILTVPNEAGSYAIDWLDRSVGLLSESSLPGAGVTVLTGHNHLSASESGPFLFLETLENEDRIFIAGREQEMYVYKVYGNYKIPADGFASIAGDVHENTLILITCEDESVEGGYLNRRVIFADPI